jgi:cardiolipin-specific phospholipase
MDESEANLSLWQRMRRKLIPTNDRLGHISLKRLLDQNVLAEKRIFKTEEGLNVVEVMKTKKHQRKGEPKTLVLLHGYGAGSGFFYRNYDELVKENGFDRILAVDWPGFALSDGKEVPTTSIFDDMLASTGLQIFQSRTNPSTSIDYFTSSLHRFLKTENEGGKENVYLAGHSLGGCLCGSYALKHPKDIKGLVLISPAGIAARPSEESIRRFPHELSLRGM